MTTLALALAIVALLANAFLALSLMEVIARLEAKPAEPVDRISAGELGPGIKGSAVTDIDVAIVGSGAHLLLVLSPLCASCRRIAEVFRDDGVPDEVFVVLTAASDKRLSAFATEYKIPSNRLHLDPDRALVDRLSIEGSPSALVIIDGNYDQFLHLGGPESLAVLIQQTREFNASGGIAPALMFQTSRKVASNGSDDI